MAQQNGESSRAGAAAAATTARRPHEEDNMAEPSFLSSLLKEVEEASTPTHGASHGPSASTSNAPTDHLTPGPSSPSISPASSNHSSPRLSSTTPPPFSRSRPISPIQLSSPVESSPPFSPEVSFSGTPTGSPAPKTSPENEHTILHRPTIRPRSRITRRALEMAHSRSPESSPSRPGPSLAVKSTIQKMVGAALKPHYRSHTLTKDQFTDINRTISRQLYERVGNADSLDEASGAEIGQAAKLEVQKTIDSLSGNKDKHPMVTSDSDGDVQ
ncbi:hypothetical protein N7468_003795 [Penicillium chermesinum]|uniref:Uncharacterized protein n=1 Tax=Penicillium chermesinum TaxID=63820 RepID=A0A9W9P724_9EURO|nr:uncharacterized protein N7468_003795 [Penicillium chermesinum]KAJ5239176.1 hypothetical protein N7468_003795 [Penicillium chermesinum]